MDGVPANDNSQDSNVKRVRERGGSLGLGWPPQESGLWTRFCDYENNVPHIGSYPNAKFQA